MMTMAWISGTIVPCFRNTRRERRRAKQRTEKTGKPMEAKMHTSCTFQRKTPISGSKIMKRFAKEIPRIAKTPRIFERTATDS